MIIKEKHRWLKSVESSFIKKIYRLLCTIGETNAVSEAYNFAMWPMEAKERFQIRNSNNYNWFVDFSGDERIATWDGVVENFRNVYRERFEGKDHR